MHLVIRDSNDLKTRKILKERTNSSCYPCLQRLKDTENLKGTDKCISNGQMHLVIRDSNDLEGTDEYPTFKRCTLLSVTPKVGDTEKFYMQMLVR
ncbi:hypothetical protein KQX54_013278 [Cotesia glomerata]|uniref:Uncharacterized protein n=1 Tax=Cotesia glomerata TaxID=32391 RepID=A0AAV7J6U4_COTGL|nr:hypothetical protein KQX54_013278 [Cotesia glomerata]